MNHDSCYTVRSIKVGLCAAALATVTAGCATDEDTGTPGSITDQTNDPAANNSSGAGGGGSTASGGSTSTPAGGSAGNGGGADTGAGPGGPMGEPGGVASVRFVGRMDLADPLGPRFAWSGSGMIATFEGSSVTLSLNDSGNNQLTVLVDGELQPKLTTQAGPADYVLRADLAVGEHRVEVYRRTEPSFGVTQFLGFDFGSEGQLLATPPAARRIEIIGDSVSTGYGNEGTMPTCGFTAETQDHYATYGAITARALDAEVITIAASGKGIVYNYGTDEVEPMPALYGRTLPQDANSSWDFSLVPDAVVINLGTNDFSTEGDPTPELFEAEYLELLERVREAYPDAFILCTVGPLLSGLDLDGARAGIRAAVAAFEAGGGANVAAWEMNVANANPGCDYHPGLATHRAMADALAPELMAAFD